MELERLIARTKHIQAIPAPTFSESERAGLMRSEFEACGLAEVAEDSFGNIYGRIPGQGPVAVVVSAHLDTVFPVGTDLTSRHEPHRLYGPGMGDNALGLASLVELGLDLMGQPLEADVWLVATVGEEGLGNLRGMAGAVKRLRDRAFAYIAVEGMSLGMIYHRSLPIRRLRVVARTAGGHAWIHAGRPSAVHTLLNLGAALLDLPRPAPRSPTVNIGRVEGGTSINAIAPQAWMEIDLRSEDEEALQAFIAGVHALLADHRRDGVDLEVQAIGDRPGGSIPADHPLVHAARSGLADAGVHEVSLEVGSTDATVPLSQGLPAVCVGLTLGGNAHSIEEYIDLPPIPQGYKALLHLVRSACRMACP